LNFASAIGAGIRSMILASRIGTAYMVAEQDGEKLSQEKTTM
jgi:hypothetical protein